MGKRHKGIGMNRPNNKKVVISAPVVEELGDDDEAEGEEEEAPEPLPPAPPPPPAAQLERVAAKEPTAVGLLKERLASYEAAMSAAQTAIEKQHKKWLRARKTYKLSGKYHLFDVPSIVTRVRNRLLDADIWTLARPVRAMSRVGSAGPACARFLRGRSALRRRKARTRSCGCSGSVPSMLL